VRIGILISHFPVVSETFVLRQLTGLTDLGHDLRIFADWAPGMAERRIWPDWPHTPVQPEVERYRLLQRTTYVDPPLEAGYWGLSAWPLTGKTWLPGHDKPLLNAGRVLSAMPVFLRAFARSPRLAMRALDRGQYGHDALTLVPLYRLARLSRERGVFDVLHAHFGWSGSNFRFASQLWNSPLVVSFHGGGDLAFHGVDTSQHYRLLFEQARAITANSEFTRERILELGCPAEKLHVLSEALDTRDFPFRERALREGESVRLLSVGRLVELKGHEYTLRALARVRQCRPNVRLDIVGEGPLRADHERLVRELGLGDVVTLHGALPGHRVRELMNAAHVFVLASVTTRRGETEGQGLVLQEAQACGLPIVTTEHGPFPEGVVRGRSALLAAERDAVGLADRIEQLIDRPERWPEMGRAGRRHVDQRYDALMLNERLLAIYEGVRAEAARRRSTGASA